MSDQEDILLHPEFTPPPNETVDPKAQQRAQTIFERLKQASEKQESLPLVPTVPVDNLVIRETKDQTHARETVILDDSEKDVQEFQVISQEDERDVVSAREQLLRIFNERKNNYWVRNHLVGVIEAVNISNDQNVESPQITTSTEEDVLSETIQGITEETAKKIIDTHNEIMQQSAEVIWIKTEQAQRGYEAGIRAGIQEGIYTEEELDRARRDVAIDIVDPLFSPLEEVEYLFGNGIKAYVSPDTSQQMVIKMNPYLDQEVDKIPRLYRHERAHLDFDLTEVDSETDEWRVGFNSDYSRHKEVIFSLALINEGKAELNAINIGRLQQGLPPLTTTNEIMEVAEREGNKKANPVYYEALRFISEVIEDVPLRDLNEGAYSENSELFDQIITRIDTSLQQKSSQSLADRNAVYSQNSEIVHHFTGEQDVSLVEDKDNSNISLTEQSEEIETDPTQSYRQRLEQLATEHGEAATQQALDRTREEISTDPSLKDGLSKDQMLDVIATMAAQGLSFREARDHIQSSQDTPRETPPAPTESVSPTPPLEIKPISPPVSLAESQPPEKPPSYPNPQETELLDLLLNMPDRPPTPRAETGITQPLQDIPTAYTADTIPLQSSTAPTPERYNPFAKLRQAVSDATEWTGSALDRQLGLTPEGRAQQRADLQNQIAEQIEQLRELNQRTEATKNFREQVRIHRAREKIADRVDQLAARVNNIDVQSEDTEVRTRADSAIKERKQRKKQEEAVRNSPTVINVDDPRSQLYSRVAGFYDTDVNELFNNPRLAEELTLHYQAAHGDENAEAELANRQSKLQAEQREREAANSPLNRAIRAATTTGMVAGKIVDTVVTGFIGTPEEREERKRINEEQKAKRRETKAAEEEATYRAVKEYQESERQRKEAENKAYWDAMEALDKAKKIMEEKKRTAETEEWQRKENKKHSRHDNSEEETKSRGSRGGQSNSSETPQPRQSQPGTTERGHRGQSGRNKEGPHNRNTGFDDESGTYIPPEYTSQTPDSSSTENSAPAQDKQQETTPPSTDDSSMDDSTPAKSENTEALDDSLLDQLMNQNAQDTNNQPEPETTVNQSFDYAAQRGPSQNEEPEEEDELPRATVEDLGRLQDSMEEYYERRNGEVDQNIIRDIYDLASRVQSGEANAQDIDDIINRMGV